MVGGFGLPFWGVGGFGLPFWGVVGFGLPFWGVGGFGLSFWGVGGWWFWSAILKSGSIQYTEDCILPDSIC